MWFVFALSLAFVIVYGTSVIMKAGGLPGRRYVPVAPMLTMMAANDARAFSETEIADISQVSVERIRPILSSLCGNKVVTIIVHDNISGPRYKLTQNGHALAARIR